MFHMLPAVFITWKQLSTVCIRFVPIVDCMCLHVVVLA